MRLSQPGQPVLVLQVQRPASSVATAPAAGDAILGRLDDAIGQLRRVLLAVRACNGERPVALVAHSWGASVAARYAAMYPEDVKALVLFAPIITRTPATRPGTAAAPPAPYPHTLWAQYRRFIEDVPRGQPQVLSEAHFQAWGAAYLATDPRSGERVPPSVMTPYGPVADIVALWSGQSLYETRLSSPPRHLWCTASDIPCAPTPMRAACVPGRVPGTRPASESNMQPT